MYRDEIYSLQILLSRTQAGPGRTVKQEQEQTSRNHVQRSAKKFFCFAKHHPGSARQKYTQPGKRNLADLCSSILTLPLINHIWCNGKFLTDRQISCQLLNRSRCHQLGFHPLRMFDPPGYRMSPRRAVGYAVLCERDSSVLQSIS